MVTSTPSTPFGNCLNFKINFWFWNFKDLDFTRLPGRFFKEGSPLTKIWSKNMFHGNPVEFRSFDDIFENSCLSMACTIYKLHANCQKYQFSVEKGKYSYVPRIGQFLVGTSFCNTKMNHHHAFVPGAGRNRQTLFISYSQQQRRMTMSSLQFIHHMD